MTRSALPTATKLLADISLNCSTVPLGRGRYAIRCRWFDGTSRLFHSVEGVRVHLKRKGLLNNASNSKHTTNKGTNNRTRKAVVRSVQ